MESCLAGSAHIPGGVLVEHAAWMLPALRRAVGLSEDVPVIIPCHVQHFPHTLVQDNVFAPLAVAAAEPAEVALAKVHASDPRGNCLPRKHLHRAMQAKTAVVEVEAVVRFSLLCDGRMMGQDISQAVGEEHSIRVYLSSPIVCEELAVLHDLPPDSAEDPGVQPSAKLAAFLAGEVLVNDCNRHSQGHIHSAVAQHLESIASKDAPALLILHPSQVELASNGFDQHEAEERPR